MMKRLDKPFALSAETETYLPLLRDLRRYLHMHPEPSAKEFETRAWIEEQLKPLRPDALRVMAETGVKAVFYASGASGEAKTLAFRADIDALNIQEENKTSYASRHAGVMHACGHDGHTALALASARRVSGMRDRGELPVNVVFLFQPAEETIGGAERMCAEGALEDPHVDEIYGFHVMPGIDVGRIGLREGPLMASTREVDILLRGVPSHGAQPHKGADAVAAAAHLVASLPTAIQRRIDPTVPRLLTFGKLEAGVQRNVIAAFAKIEGIVRTFSDDAEKTIFSLIHACAGELESLYGVTYEINEQAHYPSVINPETLCARAMALLGDTAVDTPISMTAEDFSFYQRKTPGLFMYLGCGDEAHAWPLHHAQFDFDERALLYGMELIFRLILE